MTTRPHPLYGDRDRRYFQSLEDESISRSGSEIVYYSLNRGRNVDPLYNEPIGWSYKKFILRAGAVEYVEAEGRDVGVRDEGETIEQNGIIRISYLEWTRKSVVDDNGRQRWPKAGDVMEVQREVWDVVKGNSQGNVINRPDFVAFQLEIRKRLKFIANRKIRPIESHIDPPSKS